MKKTFKVVGTTTAIVVFLLLCGLLYINITGIPSYDPGQISHEVISTPESIARGKKLALMLCANCHRNEKTGSLTGAQLLDAPTEFGTIFSANITQDKEFGIGDWTDGELVYLLRTGIKKDGQYIPPYMSKLPEMADSDIDAIISFLRSDDELVKADPTPDQPSEPSFLTKFLSHFAFKPLPMPSQPIPLPDSTRKIEVGKYLAHNLECFACHSADFKTLDPLHPEKSEGYFAGGNNTLNRSGNVVLTSNLTPDVATGIGSWSETQFINALKYGIKEGEKALQYPMTPYVQLTDDEASAIFEYLKTIPPIQNKVERSSY